MGKLTDIACKTAKGKEKPYKLADGAGLFLLVNPDGKKYWRYNYLYLQKQKTMAFGVYPETTLNEAREKHRVAHKLVKEGVDPNQVKKEAKKQQLFDASNSFEAVAIKWLDNRKDEVSEATFKDIKSRLEKDLFPRIGRLPIKSIDAPTLLKALKEIEERGVYELTKRARQYCSQIFRFAIAHGVAERDFTLDLKGALKSKKVKHHAFIEPKDLPAFLTKLNLNEARLFPRTIIATKLLILTFVRTNELLKATWDEFDIKNKLWIIPASRMKMRKDHIIPLSKQVIALLKELKRIDGDIWPHILPGQVHPKKTMSDSTILGALKRLGYQGKATGHGFRATATTALLEHFNHKYNYEIIDTQLAHSKGDSVKAAYDRAKYLKQRTEMMQDWADYLDEIQRSK
jgi:integrase